jgi:glycosyltransferase involved in cell wall biosynthesis
MSLKILTVSLLYYPDTVGGSERVIYEQSRGLAARGHEVTVVTQRAQADLPSEELIDGVRVIRYGHPRRRFWFGRSLTDLTVGRSALRRLLEREKFDAVILHHPFPAAAYFKARGRNIAPAIYVFHASVYRELVFLKKEKKRAIAESVFGMLASAVAAPILLRLVRSAERSSIGESQKIVVLSDFSKQIIKETYGVSDEYITKIPGGVDLETFRPSPNIRSLRDRLKMPTDRMIFLTIRRHVARMGLEELLVASERLFRRETNFQLYVGGLGPETERLKRLARKLGIQRFVTFLGFVEARALPDYYAAADLFVLPTVAFEGFGIATLEAIASGTPVLGTPVGASPELINQLDPSLIVQDTAPDSLAEGLSGFMRRSFEERAELRRRARMIAETVYPWRRSIDLLENELLAQSRHQ